MGRKLAFQVIHGGNVDKASKKHRCRLPSFFRTFRWATHTIVQCVECGQRWILDASYSMIDDSRCWQKYEPMYYEKTYKLGKGEFPPLW